MLDAYYFQLSSDAMNIGTALLVALALRAFPRLWTLVVGPIDRHRIHAMDGARGVLTIWVLTHHLSMNSAIDSRGVWHAPSGALGTLMTSDFFVAPFFMLTGMLFGGRLLANAGKLSAIPFFITRIFRLIPAYTASVLLLALSAMIISKFHLHTTASHLMRELARWMLFDFVKRYDINGVDMASAYGILWTLRYEMIFYAFLPLAALAQRLTRFAPIPIVLMFLISFFMWPFVFFGAGALAALGIRQCSAPSARLWCQIAAVTGLATIIVAAMFGISSHVLHAMCLVPLLVCLAVEAPLVRFLGWRPLRLVGEISYSNYVLHGAVLYLLGSTVIDMTAIFRLPPVPRIAVLTIIAAVALGGAMVCFVLIERPFIRWGARLANRFRPTTRDSAADLAMRPRGTVSVSAPPIAADPVVEGRLTIAQGNRSVPPSCPESAA